MLDSQIHKLKFELVEDEHTTDESYEVKVVGCEACDWEPKVPLIRDGEYVNVYSQWHEHLVDGDDNRYPNLTEEFQRIFLGSCVGIGLRKRGPADDHIVFQLLVGDDGNWFYLTSALSSHYVDELRDLLREVMNFLETSCIIDVVNGKVWGWKFKS